MLLSALLAAPCRNLFFTGKGGVGKTSVACAAALHLAGAGRRVLLVSTDPASNLDEVLGVGLGPTPTAIPGISGLWAVNIDPVAAAAVWRERVVGPYRGLLPAAAIRSMEEQLSGACTVEIAGFDQFSTLLGDTETTEGFDNVLFDTAPTGHTLRLLELPSAWSGYIGAGQGSTSCLGPLAGLDAQRARYSAAAAALVDRTRTALVLVSRPEKAALREAARTAAELALLGISNRLLVINGIFHASIQPDSGNHEVKPDLTAAALERCGREALAALPPSLAGLPRADIPLLAEAPMGAAGLRALLAPPGAAAPGSAAPGSAAPDAALPDSVAPDAALPGPLSGLLDALEAAGHGVVMTMGKGGVGKTTVASAIAVGLARRGCSVHLSTTDPAAHVVEMIAGSLDGLTVSRIDPAVETGAYAAEVMARAGAGLDAAGRELLAEDLRSPCTEEIAVFRAFARTVSEGAGRFVILDTAPTGHTLLLLDASESYHREISRTTSDMPAYVRSLLPRLRDPAFTRTLLVTLPAATPVHEAAALSADLVRAGIRPWAWVINSSFAPLDVSDPVLVARRAREAPFIAEVCRQGVQVALIPWQLAPPVGVEALSALSA